jgi:membrane protein
MFLRFLKKLPFIRSLIELSKRIRLPGFDGMNVHDVSGFFFMHLMENEVQSRARSIAFSFFLALFPAIIFLFTLIPYVPVAGFQDQLLNLLKDLLPPNTYEASRSTIEDIITHERGGLLSFGILFTLYVASNGFASLINAFNQTHKHKTTIAPLRQQLLAVYLTLFFSVLLILAIALLVTSEIALNFLVEQIDLKNNKAPVYFLQAGKWIILLALCFTAVSGLYYFGTAKKIRFRFISAGSILATVLIIITTLAFNYFIIHFGQYNKLYGSIGTLIIILSWIYFNCLQLIVGYELNAAIDSAKRHHTKIF